MVTTQDADHALGVELQIEELVERRERARVQGRHGDIAPLDAELGELYAELAVTAERDAPVL
ncbi:MAG: hypothetical protein ACYDH5_05510 [Acidimicrobiales bacterium]